MPQTEHGITNGNGDICVFITDDENQTDFNTFGKLFSDDEIKQVQVCDSCASSKYIDDEWVYISFWAENSEHMNKRLIIEGPLRLLYEKGDNVEYDLSYKPPSEAPTGKDDRED